MNDFFDQILSFAAPHICKGCGKQENSLCKSCYFNIIENIYDKCVICEIPQPPNIISKNGNLCADCCRLNDFSRIFLVHERKGALLRLLDDYKYNSERATSAILAKMLDCALPAFDQKTTVSYITTSSPHIRERGFDHMKIVAEKFAKIRGLKCEKLLFRESSDSQHDKNARERKLLADKMFSVRPNPPAKILLLDDIWTTGATMSAATKLLLDAGAEEVSLGIVAKQVGLHRKDM